MTNDERQGLNRLYDRIDGAGGLVQRLAETESQIDGHEKVCAERYKAIEGQFWWVRWLLIALLIVSAFEPRQIIPALLKAYGIEFSVAKPGSAGQR
jgi:hypothetical protein